MGASAETFILPNTQYTCVARTVQLSEQAYAALAALKAPGESFSSEILRILSERRDPRALLRLSPPRPDFDLGEVRARMAQADLERLRRMQE